MRPGYLVAIILAVTGAFLSTPAWIQLLRGPTASAPPELIAGVRLFRLLLLVTALFVAVAIRLGWTRKARSVGVRRRDVHHAMAIGVLICLATALRLYRLGEGLWLDEVLTLANYARLPLGVIATTYNDQNQHLLYSLLAHLSLAAFGDNAWAFRLPAALFGVGSIYATYLFGRQIASTTEALLAAALLTFSFQHLWFSQNARGYTALLFFTLLSSVLLVRGIRDREPRTWMLYAISVSFGMYSHLTMIYVVFGQFLMFVWEWLRPTGRDRGTLWPPLVAGFVLSALLTLLAYALVLPRILGPGLSEKTEAAVWLNPLWTLTETLARLQIGVIFGAVVLVGGAVLIVGFASYARERPPLLALFLGPVVTGAAVTIALQHALWPRFFFFAAGFAMLVIVRGITAGCQTLTRWLSLDDSTGRRIATGLTAVAIVISAIALPRAYGPKQDYLAARDFVTNAAGPSDAIATSGLAGNVYRHYAPQWRVVENPEDLRALDRGGAVWVVVTMPVHLEARYPELAKELRDYFEPVKQFPGTLGDGTVFVLRSKATWPAEARVDIEARRE